MRQLENNDRPRVWLHNLFVSGGYQGFYGGLRCLLCARNSFPPPCFICFHSFLLEALLEQAVALLSHSHLPSRQWAGGRSRRSCGRGLTSDL